MVQRAPSLEHIKKNRSQNLMRRDLYYSCPLGLQEVEAPRISGQWEYEGGKVVSPTQRPPLPALP